ncbi:unnamed protein product [Nezara viridula]|uniref:Charged multivesicular body protein 4b n=1 Tax=Nezara viridula TaxID=85310 RepID=A0A9P0HEY0_NEZVI|nr:unnamed protein product [Nezara viridula]
MLMNFLVKMFGKGGKKETSKKPSLLVETLEKINNIIDILNKKQEFLESKIQAETATIKKNGLRNKRVAIQALRRKKKFEQQLKQVDGTLATMELQKDTLEAARTNTVVCETLKLASDAMKSTTKNIDMDTLHEIMDELNEQQEVAKEIADVVSRPIFVGGDDDDELELELEELEQEELDREMMAIGIVSEELPSVPSVAVSGQASSSAQEDEQLKKLKEWAT